MQRRWLQNNKEGSYLTEDSEKNQGSLNNTTWRDMQEGFLKGRLSTMIPKFWFQTNVNEKFNIVQKSKCWLLDHSNINIDKELYKSYIYSHYSAIGQLRFLRQKLLSLYIQWRSKMYERLNGFTQVLINDVLFAEL